MTPPPEANRASRSSSRSGATDGRSCRGDAGVLNRLMEYRSLGRSGLKVSALSLGTMTFGGGGKFAFVGTTDAKEAKKQLDTAIAAGVNLVDTANVYSDGESEKIVGEIVKGRRDDLLLATKARFPMGDGPNDE